MIILENKRRLAALAQQNAYDPLRGLNAAGPRREVSTPIPGLPTAHVPVSMIDDPDYLTAKNNPALWKELRIRHDFEYWCVTCANILYKDVCMKGTLTLNPGQRHVIRAFEKDRLAGKPLRFIILKARQWGCTTVVSMYFAWLQLVVHTNCNSIVCGHNKDAALNVRGAIEYLFENYPTEFWDTEISAHPKLRPFAGSPNIREIRGRECRVNIASSDSTDAARGMALAMAHLTEVAYYTSAAKHSPEALMKAIVGSIAYRPGTAIILESTANGVGNFFHNEWKRAHEGRSDKTPIFVPWSMIPDYAMAVPDNEAQDFYDSFDEYEMKLWDSGLTLQQIRWHRMTQRSYSSPDDFHAEYPFTDNEAFTLSGNAVFRPEHIDELEKSTMPPIYTGEFNTDGIFIPGAGDLKIWEKPDNNARYCVGMDIGGRHPNADWSVICVMSIEPHPRLVAQWRGHTDHDILADIAMNIGNFYNNALLAVESNSLEANDQRSIVDFSLPVIEKLRRYPNLYRRRNIDTISGNISERIGFHTNSRTKQLLVTTMISAVRDNAYTERDITACNELRTYIQEENGSYTARKGCHDDIVMARSICLYAMPENREPLLPSMVP